MKLVVFAHTPPPHHGQSYMVQLMLEGLGGDRREAADASPGTATGEDFQITCYHVNAKLSRELEDIGVLRPAKLFKLIGYCFQAIWCRFRHGAKVLYYVPAPAKRSAVLRDWVVMALCRPFFPKLILHWHAVGLGRWVDEEAKPFTRWLSRVLLRRADLSIVLLNENIPDVERLEPRRVVVVGNGIHDPCPEFASAVLPRRRARIHARRKLIAGEILSEAERENAGQDPYLFHVLFLAHCSREKGLFEAVDAIALVNQQLIERNAALRIQLHVAGQFVRASEREEFDRRLAQPDFLAINENVREFCHARQGAATEPFDSVVRLHGFVSGEAKQQLCLECCCFCFPSHGESFGLVVAEAMAYGMAVVVSAWPGVQEILTEDSEVAASGRPDELAEAILRQMERDSSEKSRIHFLAAFNLPAHWRKLAEALNSVSVPRKLLVVDLWGLGDLAIASAFLQAASRKYQVTLLAKEYAGHLRRRFWPNVEVVSFLAPWTAFRGKYRLHRWPWREIFRLRRELKAAQFDLAVSARWDPRDHFLLWFIGARGRLGFPRLGSGLMLNRSLKLPEHDRHAYERWRTIARELDLELPPRNQAVSLSPVSRRSAMVLIHSGAGLPVRVWPLERFQAVARRLREAGREVQIACDASQEAWWRQHGEDSVLRPRNVTELHELLNRAAVFIGNDSGPGHVAAICGVPTLTIFGPQLPELFAPLHPQAEIIEGKPCPYKPCSDYCRYPEPHCLLKVTEEEVWQRVSAFVGRHSELPFGRATSVV